MIIDTSALLAILRDEPDAAVHAEAIARAARRRLSAGTLLEAAIVIEASHDPVASRRLDDLLTVAGVVIEPVTVDQTRIGRAAYRDFGKGSGHPAQLNLGDCFAYALAKATNEPLLFKGDDFPTPISRRRSVLPHDWSLGTGIEPGERRSIGRCCSGATGIPRRFRGVDAPNHRPPGMYDEFPAAGGHADNAARRRSCRTIVSGGTVAPWIPDLL